MGWRSMNAMSGIRPPFQGFGLSRGVVPRALPWADVVDPVGVNESRTLAALCDALLPKLLSGESRVRDGAQLPEATHE